MPRVFTAMAKKDYPQYGIVKGDKYWHWTPYRSIKHYSKVAPRPSQVESNGTRASYLACQESLEDAIQNALTLDDVRGALEEAINDAGSVKEELEEKASNIEEGFGHSTERSDEFANQANEVESWIDALQAAGCR